MLLFLSDLDKRTFVSSAIAWRINMSDWANGYGEMYDRAYLLGYGG